ncbi:hypothetical protein [Hansschlegelia sp. KR7-227]|uniref:hypothetical protein n=1 Tax=Hansschlegelia sp. KR7-227 TaxID=3400914 RepID=UPI003C078888
MTASSPIRVSPEETPSKLQRVLLLAARSPEFPFGSPQRGYDFIAPLDGDGRFNLPLWRVERTHCRVVRFSPGETPRMGLLKHRAGGADGASWCFDFDPDRSDDDEVGYRLDTHRLTPGEYVTLRDGAGSRSFQVARVFDFDPNGDSLSN